AKATVPVRLYVHALEVYHEQVLHLELLGRLRPALAFQGLLGRCPLLAEGHPDGIAHPDLEATSARATVHQLLAGRLDQVVPHARGEREDREADLSRADADPVSAGHAFALADARRRVGLGDLIHDHPTQDLFFPAQDIARLRVLELFALPIHLALHPCHHA